MSSTGTTTDFAHSLPPPLTSLLIELAPVISWLSWSLQTVTWQVRGRVAHSWLLLASWWALCLFGKEVFKYFAPALFFLALVAPPSKQKSPPATEETIQNAVNDLFTIRNSINRLVLTIPPMNIKTAARLTLYTAIPYLALSWLLRTRVLLAVCGTVLITWQAQWLTAIRRTLWKSAFIRWTYDEIWYLISGERLFTTSRLQADQDSSKTTAQRTTTEIRMLFTIIENQRWWMGLDWTAALLPAERPSWSAPNLQPVSPPNVYHLPSSTTSYLPHPQNPKLRLQRVAEWRWEEPEWKVALKIEANQSSSVQRVERPLPHHSSSMMDGSKLLKGTSKVRELKDGASEVKARVKEKLESGQGEEDTVSPGTHEDDIKDEDDFAEYTDPDGWIYGDNKWEKQAAKGGMGKYTRYRRWTRVAVLSEKVQEVGPGPMGVVRTSPVSNVSNVEVDRKAVVAPDEPRTPTSPKNAISSVSPTASDSAESSADRLRQRLKAAVRSSSTSMG